MLAGDRSADANAQLENLTGRLLGERFLTGHRGVVENERMKVAVAGMEHIRDAQTRFVRQARNLLQHAGNLRARNDSILHHVIGADAADCGERALPSAPHRLALGGVARNADLHRPRSARVLGGLSRGVLHLGERPVHVHQQRCADVGPVDARRRLDGHDRQTIHHLDCGGNNARRDDVRHGMTGFGGRRKRREERSRRLGLAQNAQQDLGDDAERPLAADQHAAQVVAGRIEHRAAEIDDTAVAEDDFRA